MNQAKYEWWQGKDADWYWHLKAPNGVVIAQGEGYKTKAGVQRGIQAHRKHASTLRCSQAKPCG